MRRQCQPPADARRSVMRAVSRRDHSIGVRRNGTRHIARMPLQAGVDKDGVATVCEAMMSIRQSSSVDRCGTLVNSRDCPPRTEVATGGGYAKASANFRQGRHDGDARGRALCRLRVLSDNNAIVIIKLIPTMLIGMNLIGGRQRRWRD